MYPYLVRCPLIEVPPSKIRQIEEFSRAVIEAKQSEEHHQLDSRNAYKRFYTGTLGEAAIEELLGVDLIDWSIGDSKAFHQADLRRVHLDIGIKTVDKGSFPVVSLWPKRPEIINVRMNATQVYVAGLATVKTLVDYQDINLIKSPSLRARGTKTGFYGFDRLLPFHNWNGLLLQARLLPRFWEQSG